MGYFVTATPALMYLYFLTITRPYRVKIGIGNQLKRRVSQVDRTTKSQQRVLIAFDMPLAHVRPKPCCTVATIDSMRRCGLEAGKPSTLNLGYGF